MNVKYLLCVFFILTIRGISFSQTEPGTNLSEVAELLSESLVPLENELVILGKDKIYNLKIEGNSEQKSFIVYLIRSSLQDYRILDNDNTPGAGDSTDYIINIDNPRLDVKYTSVYTDNVIGTKKVRRVISVSYELTINDSRDSARVYGNKVSKKAEDSFDLDDRNNVEDKRYGFLQSELPEQDTADRFIFPALIILASAAAIILFFSIRSK
ncbi:MAG: hypothetical protein JNJ56_01920 [Ignavibacteria bacterium]|nr:hypothetical protein [Ignavibacteria bacterium]